jgi:hypothetical protein
VGITPFNRVPKARFLLRLIPPAGAVFAVGYVIVGIMANQPMFQPSNILAAELPPLRMASQVYSSFIHDVTHIPEVCQTGDTVNSFQKRQCDEFWERLMMRAGLVAVPFVLFILFIMIGLDSTVGAYRFARKKVEKGKAVFSGIVTDPAQAPNDMFGWFYCLRAISVQLENKTQMTVYVTKDMPVPMPGQTLAVFDGNSYLGKKRHFAVVYAPHVAVISGGRS